MLLIEFHYVVKCPKVNEMAVNIKNAISQLDFEVEYIEKNLNAEYIDGKTFGCPSLLVNGRDLIGKVKCEIDGPLCRVYPNGIPFSKEIKKFIAYSY